MHEGESRVSRALVARCPNCGAEVRFSRESSVLAVCEYCTSTLVRQGEAVESLGRMADLFDDHTPLAIGDRGQWRGQGFVIAGRLQYRYKRGIWNEWRLLLDDQTELWLSDDNGLLAAMHEVPPPDDLPDAARLAPGAAVKVRGVPFVVANRTRVELVAAAGELPFAVTPGEAMLAVDLADAQGRMLGLSWPADDDEAGPGGRRAARAGARGLDAALGERTEIAALGLSEEATRERSREVAVAPFQCPRCAAPVQVRLAETRSLACPSCASVIDLAEGDGARVRHEQTRERPHWDLPLGTRLRLEDREFEIVGAQRRRGTSHGETFEWQEFLMHAPAHGFAFLSLDGGHASLWRVIPNQFVPSRDKHGRGSLVHERRTYHEYARYRTRTVAVDGEFFWRVSLDDEAEHADFIAPPRGLGREQTEDEVVWSQGRHVPPEELAAALPAGVRAPVARGGPSMLETAPQGLSLERYRRVFLAVMGLATLMMIAAWLAGHESSLLQARTASADGNPASHRITVDGWRDTRVEVRARSELLNREIDLEAMLLPTGGAGEAVLRDEPLYYYEGRDSEGTWTEGSRDSRIVFLEVPPGEYELEVTAWTVGAGAPLSYAYEVVQDSHPSFVIWLAVSLAAFGVFLLAVFYRVPGANFEGRRWIESDFGTLPGFAPDDEDD